MRLWYFSSSINPFFKRACADIQWHEMSDVWSDPSSTSILLVFVCLCWGLTSQSTIFQSCRDGATASWVINQYLRGVKCLAQGHNTAAVGFEPPTSRSGVRHSTTEPPRSPILLVCEQRKLWRDCADAQARLSFRWSQCDQYHNLMSWLKRSCQTTRYEKRLCGMTPPKHTETERHQDHHLRTVSWK